MHSAYERMHTMVHPYSNNPVRKMSNTTPATSRTS